VPQASCLHAYLAEAKVLAAQATLFGVAEEIDHLDAAKSGSCYTRRVAPSWEEGGASERRGDAHGCDEEKRTHILGIIFRGEGEDERLIVREVSSLKLLVWDYEDPVVGPRPSFVSTSRVPAQQPSCEYSTHDVTSLT
jgi:hypothetical protein